MQELEVVNKRTEVRRGLEKDYLVGRGLLSCAGKSRFPALFALLMFLLPP
jgi:hypothetical protein